MEQQKQVLDSPYNNGEEAEILKTGLVSVFLSIESKQRRCIMKRMASLGIPT
ncbi:hypothetical protein [Peribacillus simplex]|uniref:hypothetical protein n=1 Tax=Peribacillus simplex TaxID=1478 RepID=UPI0015C3A720|nr:hypothetical protein [Peribacillus simplex]